MYVDTVWEEDATKDSDATLHPDRILGMLRSSNFISSNQSVTPERLHVPLAGAYKTIYHPSFPLDVHLSKGFPFQRSIL